MNLDTGLFAARPAHGLTVHRNDLFGDVRHWRDPADETFLELIGIEHCEDVVHPVVRWRAILERGGSGVTGRASSRRNGRCR